MARQLRMIVVRNAEREATEMQSPKFRFLGTELLPADSGNLEESEKYYDRLSSFGERVLRNPKFTQFIRDKSRTKELRAEEKMAAKKNLKSEQKDRLAKANLQLNREQEKRDQETTQRRELENTIEVDCNRYKAPEELKKNPLAWEHCRDRIIAEFGVKQAKQKGNEIAKKRVQMRRDFNFLSLGDECDKSHRCWMDEFLLAWAWDSPWGAMEGQKTITSVRRFEARGGAANKGPSGGGISPSTGEIAFDGSSKDRDGQSIARLPFHYFEGADPDMVSHFWEAAVRRSENASTLYSPWARAVVKNLQDQWINHLGNKLGGYLDEREHDLQAREGGVPKQRQVKTGDTTRYAGQYLHHEWPGTFVGHPESLKGLWTRPGEVNDEAAGRTNTQAKVALLSDEERAKLRDKETALKAELVSRAFFSMDMTEEISEILHTALGRGEYLHAEVKKPAKGGSNAKAKGKSNASPPLAAPAVGAKSRPKEKDLRRFAPRAEFQVLGRKKQTFHLQPFRNQRNSDVLNRARMAVIQELDQAMLDHIFEDHPDSGRRSCITHLLEKIRNSEVKERLQRMDNLWKDGLLFKAERSGRASGASRNASGTNEDVSMVKAEEANAGLDGEEAPEVMSVSSFDGTFFKGEPGLNGDGSESLILQLAAIEAVPYYEHRFPSSAQYIDKEWPRKMEDGITDVPKDGSFHAKSNAAIKSRTEYNFREYGAKLQQAAKNMIWSELADASDADLGDIYTLEYIAKRFLFSRCFSFRALPVFLQEMMRNFVKVYYARLYPQTHTPAEKARLPENKYRISPFHFEDIESTKLGRGLSPFVMTEKLHEWQQELKDTNVSGGEDAPGAWRESNGDMPVFRRRLTKEDREKKVYWNTRFVWDEKSEGGSESYTKYEILFAQ